MGSPTRQDGRVEVGQKISTAFSARAWNRAQEAADIVLGDKTRFGVGPLRDSPLRFITVRVKKRIIDGMDWPENLQPQDPEEPPLRIGHAIGLPAIGFRTSIYNSNLPSFVPDNEQLNEVDQESHLSVVTPQLPWLDVEDMGVARDHFGVITNIATEAVDPETNLPTPQNRHYFLTLAIGGVFMCRAIALGPGDCLIGPPPIPSNENLAAMWRPYPLMAPAGPCRVLAVGAWYRLGQHPWPRVYECIASM